MLSSLFILSFKIVAATAKKPAFTLGVRDSLMIAHSFHNNPAFGPAGGMHGATYTCDVEFGCDELHPENNWVIDIGYALDILSKVLSKYNLKNLDEIFGDGVMTTTEFMCRQIFQDLAEEIKKHGDFQGEINVKLWESHKAWASFCGEV